MIESIIIVGFSMSFIEIFKYIPAFKTKIGKLLLPILSCFICGGLNVLNALIFGNSDISLIVALKDGIIIGALASGLYATGKKYLNKEKTE
jgi:hypothetical protein